MANESQQKRRYRVLGLIAELLSGFAIIGYLIAVLWLFAAFSRPGTSDVAGFMALLPAIGFTGACLLVHAAGQGIRLAIDCATHLATISDSLAARVTAPAHLPPAAPIDPRHTPTHPALYAALRALKVDERAGRTPQLTPADLDRLASEHGVDQLAVSETLRQIAEDFMADAVRHHLANPREQ